MSLKYSHTAVAAATICLGLTACGSSRHGTSGTGTHPGTGKAALVDLLPTAGELPGFASDSSLTTDTTIAAATLDISSVAERAAEAAQLRADGFRKEVTQSQSGGDGQFDGVAYIGAFSSPAGAARYRSYFFGNLSKPGPETGSASQSNFSALSIPGVPGAEGDSQVSRIGQGTSANVQWLEGECLFELGDASSSSSTPLTAPLITGAQSIYARTKGACASSAKPSTTG
jgi:hypothetical protein